MAKQKSLESLGSAQTVTGGAGKDTSFLGSIPPTLAYVLNDDDIDLTDDHTDDTKFLIGIRVEFRDDNGGLLAKPRIRKVYFVENPGANESFFMVSPENTAIELTAHAHGRPMTKNADEKYQLDTHTSIPAWVDNHKPFKKLRFFKEIDFVFFPVEPLRLLTHFYEKLIISGYRFETGGKLSLEANSEDSDGDNDEICFSLKIEGDDRKSNSTSDQEVDATAGSYPGTAGADVLFGHPCPPMWQQFLGVAAAIVQKRGADFNINRLNAIRAGWLNAKDWRSISLLANDNLAS